MNDLGVIHLTNGGYAVVDADLFEELNQHKWHRDFKGYIRRAVPRSERHEKGHSIMLHRVVNQSPPRVHTDHRNGVLIDCTRRNLRTADFSTSGANRGKYKARKYSSHFKGVHWVTRRQKWEASIMVHKKTIFLGHFTDERAGAIAYNAAATKYFGEFARLNEIP